MGRAKTSMKTRISEDKYKELKESLLLTNSGKEIKKEKENLDKV